MASKIEKLETASPIAIKNMTINDVKINFKYRDALYYGYANNFFADNDIPIDKVISILITNWNNATYIFSTFIYFNSNALGFLSPALQTIDSVSVRVIYLK